MSCKQVLPNYIHEKQAILKLTKREGMKELKKALYGIFSDIKKQSKYFTGEKTSLNNVNSQLHVIHS